MKRIINFLHPERVWEQSQFGFLVRINAYYTLYPYIFSFHDPQSVAFKAAEDYAAYEAHQYLLTFKQDDFQNDDELNLWKNLLEMNGKKFADFQGKKPNIRYNKEYIFKEFTKYGHTPNKPGFFCRLTNEMVKRQKRKLRGAEGTEEDKAVSLFEACNYESALSQREITAKFFSISNTLHFLQSNPSLLPAGKVLPANIPKSKVVPLVGKLTQNFGVEDDDVNAYVNWHAPIAPLIYAMSSCVLFRHDMRDDFVKNLNLIVVRHHEVYDAIFNKDGDGNTMYKYSQEKHFKVENVYALDLPLPPKASRFPKPRVDEQFLKAISDLLE